MAYCTGYTGGYLDPNCLYSTTNCGGGYGAVEFSGVEYAGSDNCVQGGDGGIPTVLTSNIEEVCVSSCGSTAI